MQPHLLVADFSSVTRHVDREILALGALRRSRSLTDTLLNWLVSSAFSVIVRNILRKDPLHYLLLSRNALHHIALREDTLTMREDFPLQEISDKTVTDKNNTVWHVAFTHNGKKHVFDVFRYLMPQADGTYPTDTEYMNKIGEMTALLVR